MKIKKVIALPALLVVVLGLTACETFKGVGRDMQRAGDAIEREAEEEREESN